MALLYGHDQVIMEFDEDFKDFYREEYPITFAIRYPIPVKIGGYLDIRTDPDAPVVVRKTTIPFDINQSLKALAITKTVKDDEVCISCSRYEQ